MDYGKFKKEITRAIMDRAEKIGLSVKESQVAKTNQGVFDTLIFGDAQARPAICIDELYKCREEKGIEEMADDTIDFVLEAIKEAPKTDFLEKTKKENTIAILVNKERNKALLEHCPHRDFLDLAIVYRCFITENENCSMVPIGNELMELMGTNEEELYQIAMSNTTRRMGTTWSHTKELMKQMLIDSAGSWEEIPEEVRNEFEELYAYNFKMATIRNVIQSFGANAMLDTSLLDEISNEFDDNIYILPSSVHELMIVPACQHDSDEAKAIVRAGNSECCVEDELLSYNVYHYNRKTKQIEIA